MGEAYGALLTGALGSPQVYFDAFASGDINQIIAAFNPVSESLLAATPLIFTGLAVALGFRAGLFNIGGEGQLYLGAIFAGWVGFSFIGLPWFIHLPLAVAFGFLGGALWGFIPGFLKARTGAHEVIVTIMLNYVAYRLLDLGPPPAVVPAARAQRPDLTAHRAERRDPADHRGPARELGLRPRPASPRPSSRGCCSARRSASSSVRSASTRRPRSTPA